MPPTSRRFDDKLFEYFGSMVQFFRGQPIILGGVSGPSGGLGGPPGGFIGYLPQTRVAYDTTEASLATTPISGASLLDNLNHIRYRIDQIILSSGSVMRVEDDGALVSNAVITLNFTNELTATDAGSNEVTLGFTATLENLDNINTSGKTGGQVLTWNSGTSMWVASGLAVVPSGGVAYLDDLNDVNTTGKSSGQVLTWNGSTLWVASGISTDPLPAQPVVINQQFIFTVDGDVDGSLLGVLPLRLYAHTSGIVNEVFCAVDTAPVSSGVRIDVLKNGTSILNSPNYVEIPVGYNATSYTDITVSGFSKNDYFKIELVQEDSAASDLSVHVRYYWSD